MQLATREKCGTFGGDGRTKVSRPTSGSRRSPATLRCQVCHGVGSLPEQVGIRLRASQRTEVFEQYHEDTHILQEIGIIVSDSGVQGPPAALRELAKLIAQDYDRETGLETVKDPLKREMLIAADRISRIVTVNA